jgi:ABC-type polysaccharide/polyol phosphate transport system ATPase subunit
MFSAPVFRKLGTISPNMSLPVIQFDRVSKKFCRSLSSAVLYKAQDFSRSLLRLKPKESLRGEEFWALRDISFTAKAGECIGIIGPNGAGKSTLLKLLNGDFQPNQGRITKRGTIQSLIRNDSGLQPLLTGRENIYIRCAEMGLDKRQTDVKLDEIIAFTGLDKSIDSPVRHYSDGMYARLAFSIATSVATDILLIDEIFAVGDIAFQIRGLERLQQLKYEGTTILFVSHSETNIRWIADRCVLLFDGELLGFGKTDALFIKYYEAVGYPTHKLQPLRFTPQKPRGYTEKVVIDTVMAQGTDQPGSLIVQSGQSLELLLAYTSLYRLDSVSLILQFWNSADVLVGSINSSRNGIHLSFPSQKGRLHIKIPFFGLTPGIYRVTGGFQSENDWLGYSDSLFQLVVIQNKELTHYEGLFLLDVRIEPVQQE